MTSIKTFFNNENALLTPTCIFRKINLKTTIISQLIIMVLLYSFFAHIAKSAEPNSTNKKFALNLQTSLEPINIKKLPRTDVLKEYYVYTTPVKYKGKLWHRLRLGFFDNRTDANKVKSQLKKYFPKAWAVKVSKNEISTAMKTTIKKPVVKKKAVKKKPPKKLTKQITSRKSTKKSTIDKMLAKAKKSLTAGKYKLAIQLYTAILETRGQDKNHIAIEYLGLARERNGQLAHAKAEYQRFLALYPTGSDAERVKQRLIGLITMARSDTPTLRKKKSRYANPEWTIYGGISQFYYRDERTTETESGVIDLSQLVSTLDITSRKRSETKDERIQMTADHVKDILNDKSDARFSRLYYELVDRKENYNIKAGRQTHSSGGVLGRFDGAILGFNLSPELKFTAAGGYLLHSNDLLDFSRDKKFLSGNLDIATPSDKWDFNIYGIQQYNGSFIDRQAMGSEIRYFDSSLSVFNLIDYDVSFGDLNIFLLNSNWIFEDHKTLFVNADIRKSPSLSTSNALMGQTELSLDDMLQTYTKAEIKQLASDRTATSHTLTVGGSLPLEKKMNYLFSSDVTVANTSGMPASGGIQEVEGTGNEYYVGMQLLGNNMFIKRDSNILALRFGFTKNSDTRSISLNSRLPGGNKWRINPRARFSQRENKNNSDSQDSLRYSLRLDYRFKRELNFETEIGQEHTTDNVTGGSQKTEVTFFNLGYRWDF